jgi:membrane protein
MPESAERRPAARVRRAWSLIAETFERFDADGVPRLAAAMSYFLLLAIAPLILILNAIVGIVGSKLGLGQVPSFDDASATAASGFTQAVSWAGSYAPYLAVGLVIVGGLSVFGQFVGALEVIWATPKRLTPVRGFLRYNALAFALLCVSAIALLAALSLSALASVFAGIALQLARDAGLQLSGVAVMAALRFAPVLIASAVLFWVAFTVAPDRPIRWLDSLSGALITSALFLIGEMGLSFYLGSTERFNVFGTFQFFVVLIVWIYYSALVALWGAELTRLLVLAAEERREAGRSASAPDAGPRP